MATTTEAPASITAEGPTTHTQNQAAAPLRARLSPQQIDFLLSGISANRIGKDGKGFAHVEAWDIRRHLIRVFGFGGFDTDLIEARLVAQIDLPAGNKTRYTVVYQVSLKLTVKVDGVELGHWHGTAIGDATNQPGLADAHDLALKTADSQALKRAAVNMGDQFGLSLYNGGALAPVVNRSLAYMKPEEAPKPVTDPPVRPEPTTQQEGEDSVPASVTAPTASSPQAVTAATGRDYLHEAHSAPDAEAVRAIYRDAKNDGAVPEYLAQIAHVGQAKVSQPAAVPASDGPDPIDQLMSQAIRNFADHLELTKILAEAGRRNQLLREVDGPAGGTVQFGNMVTARIAELKEQARQAELNGPGAEHQRSAA
ncbi:Rad52/Rad22 family DNA repair protein [Streptomyces sp. NPDC020196]|uniref:Rad52/Rad22 family DNA repair protein n=1 Tax=Streptomyces sp. NPDC020196 TaxID=3156656 RepID=UPI0034093F88